MDRCVHEYDFSPKSGIIIIIMIILLLLIHWLVLPNLRGKTPDAHERSVNPLGIRFLSPFLPMSPMKDGTRQGSNTVLDRNDDTNGTKKASL